MAYRPRIGLTMRLELATRRFYLGRDYSEALEAAGAVPVHIPLVPKKDFISSVVEGLDGILLPGCDSDVDPVYYAEEPHRGLGNVVPEKDETDLLVLAEAERRNIPVLGICYGIQVLNVSRGGSLVQDIESQIEGCLKHSQGQPGARNSHRISIAQNTILSRIAGQGTARVNSHHHQSVKTLGRDLMETARANDGVIEGIEDTRPDRFVVGVQWHPELSWNTDGFSRGIFESFVAACAARASVEVEKEISLNESRNVIISN